MRKEKNKPEGTWTIRIAEYLTPEMLAALIDRPQNLDIPKPDSNGQVTSERMAEKRAQLLGFVSVDQQGVAHCINLETSVTTSVIAVRLDDDKQAKIVPFVTSTKENVLELALPEDRPSRIGFFVTHDSRFQAGVLLRSGEFPGKALTTRNINDLEVTETFWAVDTIRDYEPQVKQWANQAGVTEIESVKANKVRGIFAKSHQADPKSDYWQDKPIVVLPQKQADLLDDKEKTFSRFQVLLFSSQPTEEPSQTREMVTGYGKAERNYGPLSWGEFNLLEGAFDIKVVPQVSR